MSSADFLFFYVAVIGKFLVYYGIFYQMFAIPWFQLPGNVILIALTLTTKHGFITSLHMEDKSVLSITELILFVLAAELVIRF